MVNSLSHFDQYVYVTAEGFDAANVDKHGVDESLLLLLKNAGIDLKIQYGIGSGTTASVSMGDEASAMSRGYAKIFEDPIYSLVATVSPDVVSKYNIGDMTQSVETRRERLSALLNDVRVTTKGASLTLKRSATNINDDVDLGMAKSTHIDSNTYDKVQTLLQQEFGRAELSDDPEKLEAINTFLRTFPYRNKKVDGSGSGPWVNMTVKQLFRQTIQTAIDIINDLAEVISNRNVLSAAEYRRSIFDVFARKSRRTYVGLWLIFLYFLLYFIDSST